MEIALIISILLAFIAGFFCAIKAVQLGLRWQLQAEVKQEPVLNNPIVDTIAQNKVEKTNQHIKEAMQEWLYGK